MFLCVFQFGFNPNEGSTNDSAFVVRSRAKLKQKLFYVHTPTLSICCMFICIGEGEQERARQSYMSWRSRKVIFTFSSECIFVERFTILQIFILIEFLDNQIKYWKMQFVSIRHIFIYFSVLFVWKLFHFIQFITLYFTILYVKYLYVLFICIIHFVRFYPYNTHNKSELPKVAKKNQFDRK